MKKSFVAMALILVLCMSQFLIGNAAGKALDINVVVPEWDTSGAYTGEEVDGGVKFTGTSAKTEWSCVMGTMEGNLKEYAKLVMVVDGVAGTEIMLKLQNGKNEENKNIDPVEKKYTLEGGVQTIEWTLEAANLTTNGQEFVIFIEPGDLGATNPVIVKSAKLCTADYVEPAVPETPETGDSFNMVPAVMMVLAAFVFVVAYAKKRAF